MLIIWIKYCLGSPMIGIHLSAVTMHPTPWAVPPDHTDCKLCMRQGLLLSSADNFSVSGSSTDLDPK